VKRRLVDLLVCPACQVPLALEPGVVDADEVLEGRLTCQDCRRAYPIRGGVPRFVGESSYADAFGFEWHRFRTVQLDSANGTGESAAAFARKTGLTAEDVRGKLVLDGGVGAGRYAEVVADWGGEAVGVDVTGAVDAAFANIGRRPDVHLVQADIFALPFRDETFDLAYSIGVLHHTPAPAAAFARVAAAVRKGGQLAIYVYEAAGLARHCSDLIRVLTTRLPLRIVYVAASAAGPLYYLYRVPLAGRLFRTLLPISLHARWRWRWLDTFDWYTPKYQWKFLYPEVFRWFRANGFLDIEVFDKPIQMRGMKTR
jgi:SAM-dependent methyltransferase